ncbi:hypothetical protein KBZ14_13825 [Synechococcus sp. HJ21-Hayes]|jgi:putative transposase|uniref:hypothetical protein n=1 Tax=unclassified Synechococcus TaxID=2626047 RepID=UPI0020CCB7EA|nr:MULTISPECIES: hypothetical protein [unclassified Synechococcus]MCP9832351.1 hypothetical protein [Synechococcus sp. JJ3a-Johnson]MCP9853937.1 hypothetical protein [Synechococcus sp. HJ21-Hayes]
MSKRHTQSPEFKARVAMDAISDRKTIQEIAADNSIQQILIQFARQLEASSSPRTLRIGD